MNDFSLEPVASADGATAPGQGERGWTRRLRRAVMLGPLERRLFWIVVAGLLPLILLSFATLLYNAQVQRRQQI